MCDATTELQLLMASLQGAPWLHDFQDADTGTGEDSDVLWQTSAAHLQDGGIAGLGQG